MELQQTVFEKPADSFKLAWYTLPDSFEIPWGPCQIILIFWAFYSPLSWRLWMMYTSLSSEQHNMKWAVSCQFGKNPPPPASNKSHHGLVVWKPFSAHLLVFSLITDDFTPSKVWRSNIELQRHPRATGAWCRCGWCRRGGSWGR